MRFNYSIAAPSLVCTTVFAVPLGAKTNVETLVPSKRDLSFSKEKGIIFNNMALTKGIKSTTSNTKASSNAKAAPHSHSKPSETPEVVITYPSVTQIQAVHPDSNPLKCTDDAEEIVQKDAVTALLNAAKDTVKLPLKYTFTNEEDCLCFARTDPMYGTVLFGFIVKNTEEGKCSDHLEHVRNGQVCQGKTDSLGTGGDNEVYGWIRAPPDYETIFSKEPPP